MFYSLSKFKAFILVVYWGNEKNVRNYATIEMRKTQDHKLPCFNLKYAAHETTVI